MFVFDIDNDDDNDDDNNDELKNSTMTNFHHAVHDHGGILHRANSHHTITEFRMLEKCIFGFKVTYGGKIVRRNK